MSARKPTPPDDVVAYANALLCSDCGGHGTPGERDAQGQWHITVVHQRSCPRLRSGAPDKDAMARAAAAVARVVQQPTELTVTDPRGPAR